METLTPTAGRPLTPGGALVQYGSCYLRPSQLVQLRALSTATAVPAAAILRRALDLYLTAHANRLG